ncbi:tetra-peptide repeat homeobox protein 1-like isoform X1 [Amphibalanus amphitrite]|uniref:tetra-peptide repeat homeobox protein 1-like isoform X1 n=1 Tax=Amphibalanus amphitrite TaxID=1232801 RepID=UPI001C91BDF7|nr:tetra-peptide repeat homeobox protein 1-like isoform X1 [Amphibalanus amphitrite]
MMLRGLCALFLPSLLLLSRDSLRSAFDARRLVEASAVWNSTPLVVEVSGVSSRPNETERTAAEKDAQQWQASVGRVGVWTSHRQATDWTGTTVSASAAKPQQNHEQDNEYDTVLISIILGLTPSAWAFFPFFGGFGGFGYGGLVSHSPVVQPIIIKPPEPEPPPEPKVEVHVHGAPHEPPPPEPPSHPPPPIIIVASGGGGPPPPEPPPPPPPIIVLPIGGGGGGPPPPPPPPPGGPPIVVLPVGGGGGGGPPPPPHGGGGPPPPQILVLPMPGGGGGPPPGPPPPPPVIAYG